MLETLYVTRDDDAELARRVSTALRSTHLRKMSTQGAIPAPLNYAPDLIVTGLEPRTGVVEIKGLRKAYPKSLIIVTARNLSGEKSAKAYLAGATTVVPLSALGKAISNLTHVLRAGDSRKPDDLSETMVEEFHDHATGRLDANAVARGIGVPTTVLAKSIGLTPSALSKRPDAKAAQEGLRQIEFVVAALRRLLESDARVRAWLNAPHPDLGGEAPISLLTKGTVEDLAAYIRATLSGQTS